MIDYAPLYVYVIHDYGTPDNFLCAYDVSDIVDFKERHQIICRLLTPAVNKVGIIPTEKPRVNPTQMTLTGYRPTTFRLSNSSKEYVDYNKTDAYATKQDVFLKHLRSDYVIFDDDIQHIKSFIFFEKTIIKNRTYIHRLYKDDEMETFYLDTSGASQHNITNIKYVSL